MKFDGVKLILIKLTQAKKQNKKQDAKYFIFLDCLIDLKVSNICDPAH